MNDVFSFQVFAEYSAFFLILIIFIYFLYRFDRYIQSYIDQENKKKLKNKFQEKLNEAIYEINKELMEFDVKNETYENLLKTYNFLNLYRDKLYKIETDNIENFIKNFQENFKKLFKKDFNDLI